ncbi:hypothetical protein C6P40_000267 [Pichia californica]|uniref:WW domain-containing protein n=1 Tax=Pichia californica TaxID=460514 RepID=A0A9P7BGN7_9ASCO|nr:hypothetical protein C6P42_003262 [[Candida] californica]KAG0688984.1 hypothetical protein C6P40_000267 [[Candida] californica]
MFQKSSTKQDSKNYSQLQPTTKLKRSSSILNRLIRRSSNNSQYSINTKPVSQKIISNQFEPSSPAISANSQFSTYSNNTTSSSESLINNNQSNEKLPLHWELRYDTILCQFYYLNTNDNTVQFDSPLEVLKR